MKNLSFLELVNTADYSIVKTSYGDSFYITGIKTYKNDQFIGFTRLCADTLLLDGTFKDVSIYNGNIIIQCGNTEYTVIPKHIEEEKSDCKLNDNITLDDLMKNEYINHYRTKRVDNKIYLPLWDYKIGKLNRKQETAIKKLMEQHLNGAQEKYQFPRLPAFSVEFNGDDYRIYAYIYDLINNEYFSETEIYNSEDDLNHINPYEAFIRLARTKR